MAKFWLMNAVSLGTIRMFPGDEINDAIEDAAAIRAAGGNLYPQGDAAIDAAAALALNMRKNRGANERDLTDIMQGALDTIQGRRVSCGTATLAAGTVTVTGVVLTSTSRIVVERNTPAGTLGAGGYAVPSASRTAAQFVINAVDLAGATVATDTSTVDWAIVDDGV